MKKSCFTSSFKKSKAQALFDVCIKTESDLVSKSITTVLLILLLQWSGSMGLQNVTFRIFYFLSLRFLEIDASQIPKLSRLYVFFIYIYVCVCMCVCYIYTYILSWNCTYMVW